MTLTITLSPELQERVVAEAARRGQRAEEFVQAVLEERMAAVPADPIAMCLEGLPRPTPDEIQALLRSSGAKPVKTFAQLLGAGAEQDGEPEFDVDEFLKERRRWQWEGAPAFSASEAPHRPAVPRP